MDNDGEKIIQRHKTMISVWIKVRYVEIEYQLAYAKRAVPAVNVFGFTVAYIYIQKWASTTAVTRKETVDRRQHYQLCAGVEILHCFYFRQQQLHLACLSRSLPCLLAAANKTAAETLPRWRDSSSLHLGRYVVWHNIMLCQVQTKLLWP